MAIQPEHRSILVVDIEEFSQRPNRIQLDLHRRLRRLLQDAFQAAEISKDACEWEDRGDGFLVTISAEAPKTLLLDPVILLLAKWLDTDNRAAQPTWRLRLRVVVHAGEVLRDPKANVGQAVVAACRLLDAPELRAHLKATSRPLVVAVTDWIHQEVVQHGYGRIDRAAYRPMRFTSKNTIGHAWVHVPDPTAPVAATSTRSRPPGTFHQPTEPHGDASESLDAAAQEETAVPVDLPGDIPSFTGRSKELKTLQTLFADTRRRRHAGLIVVSAIAGKGGVGKTALAIHAAYRLQPQFPDGQLYVNLRGTERQALQPADVLAQLLRALGVPSALVPESVDERAGLYRRQLTTRRMLIVLDNAADEAQVRPLLPGGGSSAVLITSRALLAGLDTATTIHLDVLHEDEALDLLSRLGGRARVDAEPEAAKAISRLCGYLPLAVRIAGAKLNANPHLPLPRFARQLADQHRRLDTLHVGDLDLRASFALSYQQLPADQQRLFRLLGLQEGPSISVPAAQALLNHQVGNTEDREAEELLEQLVILNLLDRPILGRYRLHDLLRLFAYEQAISVEPEAERTMAQQRLFTFYLATTQQADQRIRPGRPLDGELATSPQQLSFRDLGEASEWLELERATLATAVQQAAATPSLLRIAGDLADALRGFFELRSHFTDWEQTGEAALTAAKQERDTRALATARLNLGIVALLRHRLDQAMRLLKAALRGYEQLDDRLGQARALTSIGNLHRNRYRHDLAVHVLKKGLNLRREQGDPHGEAVTLFLLGLAVEQRNHEEALAHFKQSLALFGQFQDRWGQLNVRYRRGVVYRAQGRNEDAVEAFDKTLELSRELGHRGREADALTQLGLCHHELGHNEQSVTYLEDALSVRRSVGDQYGEAETLRHLGEVLWANGQYQQAQVCWETARVRFDGVGAQREADEVQALATAEPPGGPGGSRASEGRHEGG
jgi:tetratricopeptide (TPR) repeat protein